MTPILLLAFNRPDYLRQLLTLLREVAPTDLYVSIDGPRLGRPDDVQAHKEILEVLKTVDWKCHVYTHMSSKNLGCKLGVSTGITWFFKQVKAGIILEDDCMPDKSFFPYVDELLARYKDDERVGMIGGSNLLANRANMDSYFFSIHPHCWGWATWRRAWNAYDVTLRDLKLHGNQIVRQEFNSQKSVQYWMNLFVKTRDGEIDTWDYQWIYTCWKYQMLCIVPTRNLITNIGFDSRATHTKLAFSPLAWKAPVPLDFPLQHPKRVVSDHAFDMYMQAVVFEQHKFLKLVFGLRNYIRRFFSSNVRMDV